MARIEDIPSPGASSSGCVLLMSGGMDSTVLCAALRSRRWQVSALTALYGQRHEHEVSCARTQASILGCAQHEIVSLPTGPFSGSALTDGSGDVPRGRDVGTMTSGGIPATYVPARNLVLLALATAWAESLGVADVFIAVNAIDYSGYPDCRPEFVEAFGRAARLATSSGVSVHAPLVRMTKADIVSLGSELGVDLARTSSCYDPDPQGRACGLCDACVLRARGFEQARVPDPTRYAREES